MIVQSKQTANCSVKGRGAKSQQDEKDKCFAAYLPACLPACLPAFAGLPADG